MLNSQLFFEASIREMNKSLQLSTNNTLQQRRRQIEMAALSRNRNARLATVGISKRIADADCVRRTATANYEGVTSRDSVKKLQRRAAC
jgi:hypothetical protein